MRQHVVGKIYNCFVNTFRDYILGIFSKHVHDLYMKLSVACGICFKRGLSRSSGSSGRPVRAGAQDSSAGGNSHSPIAFSTGSA
jgi:hypothetical protein